jgi:hypothetical protein
VREISASWCGFHLFAAGEDFVPPVFFVPLGEGGRHVHLLDDVPPTHTRVVSAEGNLAFLRRVRNNALLGAPEVVIEQILEPHSGDEQEVPTIRTPLLNIGHRAIPGHFAIRARNCLLRHAETFVEFLDQVAQSEVSR